MLSERHRLLYRVLKERHVPGERFADPGQVYDGFIGLYEGIAALEAQLQSLREALELLGGTPKSLLDHCIINELLERPVPKHISLDSYCRKLIVKESLDAK